MRDVVIARDYLMNGLRQTAEDLVTRRLGPRRPLEIAQARGKEVIQDRWTGLDREIDAGLEGRRITEVSVTPTPADATEEFAPEESR